MKLLCAQVLKDLLGEGIDYEKVSKLTADAKFEHTTGLCKSYEDKHSALQDKLRETSLRLSRLDSVSWRVDYVLSSSELKEVNEPEVHLKLQAQEAESGSTETTVVSISADKFRVLLTGLFCNVSNSSVKMKLLCAQVLKDLLGEGIDYEKVSKLTADAKFEHTTGLCKSYEDKHSALQDKLRETSLRLSRLDSVSWRVDYVLSSSELKEVNEPEVHLKLQAQEAESGSTETTVVSISADKFRVLLTGLNLVSFYTTHWSTNMPEGPELHLASLFVNRVCEGVLFTGPVTKSAVSKNCDVAFTCEAYRIRAASRGKEVKLTLTPVKREEGGSAERPVDVVFRFGMSGYFRFTPEVELPKHAHLRFSSNEKPRRVLSFVDARRFGSWQVNGSWQPDRGPCVMLEYESFRENVISNLSDRAFDRPICEALLNQKLNIPPFVQARSVLEGLQPEVPPAEDVSVKEETTDKKTSDKAGKIQAKSPDLLRLCHIVPLEVVNMGGKGYDPQKADYSEFQAWLQCYYVAGMTNARDHNGRTMWFSGEPGPMAPKVRKSTKAKKRTKKEDHDHTVKKKVAVISSTNKMTTKQVQQEAEKGEIGSRKKTIKQVTGTQNNTRCRRSRKTSGADTAAEPKRRSLRSRLSSQ
ncbi:hypothetical protein CRUP_018635 [Coryphaenoides rupestris]|nr:hypothetical protein CRUP_018635 [Coryphaenoides rupestris]